MEKLQKAIVLGLHRYEEFDGIANFYCEDNTRIALFVKSVFKAGSKNRVYLNTGSIVEIEYFPARLVSRMGRLKTAYGEEVFLDQNKSIESEIGFLLNILRQLDFNESKKSLWDAALKYLYAAKNGFVKIETRILLLYNVYQSLGLKLELKCCYHCKTTKDIYSISIANGGLVCKNCIGEHEIVIDKNTLLQIILFLKLELDEVGPITFEREVGNYLFYNFVNFLQSAYGVNANKY